MNHDPENDPADEVNFKDLDLSESIEEQICPSCSWELDAAGDCPNPNCDESPNYTGDVDDEDEDIDA